MAEFVREIDLERMKNLEERFGEEAWQAWNDGHADEDVAYFPIYLSQYLRFRWLYLTISN